MVTEKCNNLRLARSKGALDQPETNRTAPSFLGQHGQKLTALLFWVILLVGYGWYTTQNNLTPWGAVQQLVALLSTSVYGPLIYLVVYTLRPLIFFSATLLTVAAGYLFGPVLGVTYTVIGSNLSATLAYLIGRYFGDGTLESGETEGVVQRYARRMRANSFETVLIMRFIFLPYDLVNYLAGLLRINYKAFITATILGSIPGTISFTLFGASIEGDFSQGTPELNPWVLVTSVAIFIVSLILSRYFKTRESHQQEAV